MFFTGEIADCLSSDSETDSEDDVSDDNAVAEDLSAKLLNKH